MNVRGKLEKLVIHAFTTPDYQAGSEFATFEAFVNPSEITLSYEIEYDSTSGTGTTNSRMEFKKQKPGDLSLSFFIDGTGAKFDPGQAPKIGENYVQDKIMEFQQVTGYNGDIHRTHYLIVSWGTLEVRRCVLKSASIAYKMFRPNGMPLRAIISATFTDNSDDRTRVAIAQDQSPDLTHVRVIKAGDNLPMLCNRIYGDPQLYLRVAQANNLDDFRNIAPGTRILFPPLEKQS